MTSRFTIVAMGEAFISRRQGEQQPGGSPLLVAYYAHQLAQPRGGRGVAVSRVGQDPQGSEIINQLIAKGMDPAFLQTDPDLSTGRAYLQLEDGRVTQQEITDHVAWEMLQYDPDVEELARRCDGVWFGTLGQRHSQSRQSVNRFLEQASHAVALFDVDLNLHACESSILRRCCEQATVLTIKENQLHQLLGLLGMDVSDQPLKDAQALLSRYSLKMVALISNGGVTRLLTSAGVIEPEPVTCVAEADCDETGVQEACAAAILTGLSLRLKPEKIAAMASHAGAFVASKPGAWVDFIPEIGGYLR